MAKKDRQFWESAAMNNGTYKQYYNRLVELAISMFEWKNLPKTVDARFLELCLFTDGQAIFFYDEDDNEYFRLMMPVRRMQFRLAKLRTVSRKGLPGSVRFFCFCG